MVSSWPTAHRTLWAIVNILDILPHFAHMLGAATAQGWVGWGDDNMMITVLGLAHMLDATQLLRDGWGGGMITFSTNSLASGEQKVVRRFFQDFQNVLFFTCYSHILQFPLYFQQFRLTNNLMNTHKAPRRSVSRGPS